MPEQEFKIKVFDYEGPLDLILDLIEKRKLSINEISLASITEDYISYLKSQSEMNLEDNSSFILTASTLLLIKSRSLLPEFTVSQEEKDNIQDLEKRLKLLEEIRESSKLITQIFLTNPCFLKRNVKIFKPVFAPHSTINSKTIHEAVLRALMLVPQKEKPLQKVEIKKIISLEEMINKMVDRVKISIKMSFRDFARVGQAEKVNVIVSFLALLELVKQGRISVKQENTNDDIMIETKEVSVPNYS